MIQTIYLGAGCFWCTEAIFRSLKGVTSVEVGYMDNIEVGKIEFDDLVLGTENLLKVFFALHDPTSIDRQGADTGIHYRSAIFFTSEDQKYVANKLIEQLKSEGFGIVTVVTLSTEFKIAENYHQNFYEKYKGVPYCQLVIDPKLAKLRQKFASLLAV